jgi:hypothetical protein
MQKIVMVLAVSAVIMSLLYSPVASLAGDMPEADGAVLWKYITEDSPYSKWDHWPGLPGIYKGTPPPSFSQQTGTGCRQERQVDACRLDRGQRELRS